MKRTNQRSKIKRVRKHGFRKRMRENYLVILNRRRKGRWQLTV